MPSDAPLRCLADTAYSCDRLRAPLFYRGALPVTLNNPARRRMHSFDQKAGRECELIERAPGRQQYWQRIATRCDCHVVNYQAVVEFAAIVIYWL